MNGSSKILTSAIHRSSLLVSNKAAQRQLQQQACRRISNTVSKISHGSGSGSSSGSSNRSSSRSTTSLLWGVASSLVLPATSFALCESSNDKGGFLDKIVQKDKDGNTDWAKSLTQVTEADFWDTVATASGDKLQTAYDTGIPSQLSYGFACGFCSGYALRVVGRGAALVTGLGFMSLQTLSYYGYIKVDHTKFQDDFNRVMDLNKDGKVDQEDAKLAYGQIAEVLAYSLPAGSGFGGGFIAGIRRG